MRFLTKKRLFILKHYDFLLADLIAFVLGYLASLAFRRCMWYNQPHDPIRRKIANE